MAHLAPSRQRSCFSLFFSSKERKEKKPLKEEKNYVIHPYSDVKPPTEPPPAGVSYYNNYSSLENNNYYGNHSFNNLPPSSLSSMNGQLKCKRCQIFYNPKVEEIDEEKENQDCHFHSGSFIAKGIAPKQWTCCGGTREECPPCASGKHIECKITTQNIRKYKQLEDKYMAIASKSQISKESLNRNSLGLRSSSDKKQEKKEEEDSLVDLDDVEVKEITDPLFFLSGPCLPKREEFSDAMARRAADSVKSQRTIVTQGKEQYLKHVLKSTDNLIGLSVRYNVKVEEIRYCNRLLKDSDLFTRPVVLIPYRGQKITNPNKRTELDERKQEMKRMVKRFHKQTGCESESEAKFYLDDSNFDYDAAIRAFNEDCNWEKK